MTQTSTAADGLKHYARQAFKTHQASLGPLRDTAFVENVEV